MSSPKSNIAILLLYPFSLIYGLVVGLRNILFDFQLIRSREFTIPIISVGNISVGGTGKTPHVEYLIKLLKQEFRVATLSRGYKRKTRDYVLASAESSVSQIGDEPLQMKHKFPDVDVAVDRSRVNGVKRLMQEIPDLDVVILDDAFQHRYIKPGLSILLIDYNRPIWEDYLLPAGRMRENANEKRRAGIILITKCPDRFKPIDRRLIVKKLKLYPFQNLFFTKLKYGEPLPVFSECPELDEPGKIRAAKPEILMLTGIANPRLFKKHLRGISTRITELQFPDHHDYSKNDLELIAATLKEIEGKEKYIFTTEKDAVRFQALDYIDTEIKSRLYYIPVEIEFINEDENNFNHLIYNYVRNNKRNSILHQ